MKQSVDVKCEASRDMPSGVSNHFLEHDLSAPPKAEYTLVMARRGKINLKPGVYYRMTFEEIDPPPEL